MKYKLVKKLLRRYTQKQVEIAQNSEEDSYYFKEEDTEDKNTADDVADEDGRLPNGEYEILEREITPKVIICPDCGGLTLEGLEVCDKCGGELNFPD